ncbi:hypothetical protein [Variovorax saccharolyticus]|uniref:hypothetical protein n=1 Tax=Variovorax saccharolyticus TaxID=3053516 RepID=UPI002576C8F0|nr:hypothetical protein [Variovorax sp. J31P216]MDM0029605.1 hypothetical protein [Variovorax sp. J31P216]
MSLSDSIAFNMTNALDAGMSAFADRMDRIRDQREARERAIYESANEMAALFTARRKEAAGHEDWIEHARRVRTNVMRKQFEAHREEYALRTAREDAADTFAMRSALVQELRDSLDFYTATCDGLAEMFAELERELIERDMHCDPEWVAAAMTEIADAFVATPWVNAPYPRAQPRRLAPHAFSAWPDEEFPRQPTYVPVVAKEGMLVSKYNHQLAMSYANWLDEMKPVRNARLKIMEGIQELVRDREERTHHLNHQITLGKAQAEFDQAYARYLETVIDGLRESIRTQQGWGFAWSQLYEWLLDQAAKVPGMEGSQHLDAAARAVLTDKQFRHAWAKILAHEPLVAPTKHAGLVEMRAA